MTWLFAVVVVAVIAVVAVVATGRGGELSQAYDDRRDVRVQADGPLTAQDLADVRFTTALRGYRMSEVDALLDRLITELQGRSQVALRPEGVAQPDAVPDPSPHAGPDAEPGTGPDVGPRDGSGA